MVEGKQLNRAVHSQSCLVRPWLYPGAEFGKEQRAVVNVGLKSGTNALHSYESAGGARYEAFSETHSCIASHVRIPFRYFHCGRNLRDLRQEISGNSIHLKLLDVPMEQILAKEEEHADDMNKLLETLSKDERFAEHS